MKDKIYISVPVNVARNTILEMKKICPDAEVFNSSQRFYQDDLLFLECIKNGNLEDVPDLLVTIRPEIQWALNALKELNRFDTQFRYPVRDGLTGNPLFDDTWLLKPLYVMPLVMFCSEDLEEPPTSWRDLLSERFRGRVITTDSATPPAALVRWLFVHLFGSEGERFITDHLAYRGLPIDVNKAVSSKEYAVGVMPLSFAAFSKNNSTRVCWPAEGALPLTQVMLIKNNAGEACLNAARHLVSLGMQQTFSDGASFLPVHPEVPLPKAYLDNGATLFWQGWQDFLAMGVRAS